MNKSAFPRVELGLGLLFFFHLMGVGLFMVSLGNILKECGYEDFIHIAMSTVPLACMIAPLMMGALADTRFDAGKVLSVLLFGSGITLYAAFAFLDAGFPAWVFIGAFSLRALCFAPTFGLVSAIAFTLLGEKTSRFPRVRLWGTFGWVVAGWLVSDVLLADASTLGGKVAAVLTLALAVVCWFLPPMPPPDEILTGGKRSLVSVFGFSAFSLLKNPDHRALFVTSTMLSIPIAAFYIYTPMLLKELGDQTATKTMTLGQSSEILFLLLLPLVVGRFRLKWILLGALLAGLARYLLFALGAKSGNLSLLQVGISLHGLCYVGFFVTAQIYLAERIGKTMRAQAQSLLVMLNGGVGTLVGTVLAGELFKATARSGSMEDWMVFWGVLLTLTVVTTVYFLFTYRGVNKSS